MTFGRRGFLQALAGSGAIASVSVLPPRQAVNPRQVFSDVRALLGDTFIQDGEVFTDSVLAPHLRSALRSSAVDLTGACVASACWSKGMIQLGDRYAAMSGFAPRKA